MKKYIVLALIIGSLSNCATFQSPKVLEEGEQSLTIGAAYVFPSSFDIELSYRRHVAEGFDMGLQLSYFIYVAAVADVKYQILTEPFYLATSIGAGVMYSEQFHPLVQALLIGGGETFYAGIKPVVYLSEIDSLEYLRIDIGGGIFAGLAIGEKKRLSLEANANYYGGGFPITLGASWRFVF